MNDSDGLLGEHWPSDYPRGSIAEAGRRCCCGEFLIFGFGLTEYWCHRHLHPATPTRKEGGRDLLRKLVRIPYSGSAAS